MLDVAVAILVAVIVGIGLAYVGRGWSAWVDATAIILAAWSSCDDAAAHEVLTAAELALVREAIAASDQAIQVDVNRAS